MSSAVDKLWQLYHSKGDLSPRVLLEHAKLAAEVGGEDFDYRSQLLVRDSLDAIAQRVGERWLVEKLEGDRSGNRLMQVWKADFDEERGFPSLAKRVMEPTTPKEIIDLLMDLSRDIRNATQITLSGSAVLILKELVVRHTEDVDLLDDVPSVLRENQELLKMLHDRHELEIGHTASHYLPEGWRNRVWSVGVFGHLTVFGVDPVDLLVGKIFSKRAKDFRDLRHCWPSIDTTALRSRVIHNTRGLRSLQYLQESAKRNWYVLTGEDDLPPLGDTPD